MNEERVLPDGWVWTTLGEMLPIQYGKGLVGSSRNASGQVPVYGSSGIVGLHNQPFTTKAALIIGRKGSVGSVYYSPAPCWPIDTVYFVEESENINLKFFLYLLSSLELNRLDKSTAIPGLSRDDYNAIAVKIPPLPEQQRIVAAIEEQFTRLDAAVDALQHTKARLKRSRASVLKAAVEGKLTEAWRAEHDVDETAPELLERILVERRTKWEADLRAKGKDPAKVKYVEPAEPNVEGLPDLPEEWCWATAEQIGDVGTGATPLRSRSDYYENGTIPWITSGALNSDIITYAEEFITEKALEETNVKVFPTGTLLVAMYGEGKTRGKVSELKINATTNQACAAIAFRPISALCQPYIKIFMQSNYIEIRRLAVSGAQPNLNLEIVKQTLIPLPPLSEQQQIVAEVEERLSVINQAETTIEVSLKRAERTRQSILQKAFTGQLVPQDSDDEPASVLLERIREERGKAKDGGRANKMRMVNRDVSEPERVDVQGMEQVALWGSVER